MWCGSSLFVIGGYVLKGNSFVGYCERLRLRKPQEGWKRLNPVASAKDRVGGPSMPVGVVACVVGSLLFPVHVQRLRLKASCTC